MEQIAIGDEGDRLALGGPEAEAPFGSAVYRQGAGEGDEVEDSLEVNLEAPDPAAVASGIEAVERWLVRVEERASQRLDDPVFLWVTPFGDIPWRSPLVGGSIEARSSSPEMGAACLRLRLTRCNYWEGPETQVRLSNSFVPPTLGELSVINHNDSSPAHDNYVEIAGEDVAGSLPTPALIRMRNLSAGTVGQVLIGALQHGYQGELFEHNWEGEAASGGSSQPDAACSGGARQTVTWNGPGEMGLLTWSVQVDMLARAGARPFRGILRLSPAPGYDDLWLRLKVMGGGSLLYETPWTLVPAGSEVVDLGAFPLPPYAFACGTFGAVDLALFARRKEGGPSTLSVDALTLLPLDGWRRLVSREGGLAQNRLLVDDGEREAVYVQDGPDCSGDFVAYGEPIWLLPADTQRLVFFQVDQGGLRAPIDRVLNVCVHYQPRRRVL